MEIKPEDIIINVQRVRYSDEYPSRTRGIFVTIKHVPTEIEVCKYHKSALVAKEDCIAELKELLEKIPHKTFKTA